MITVKENSKDLHKLRVLKEGKKATIYCGSNGTVYKRHHKTSERCFDNIYQALERQSEIQHTLLPCGYFYIDNEFMGPVMSRIIGFNISTIRHFPLREQVIILEKLVRNVKELTKNYIYPTDLLSIGSLKNQHNVLVTPGFTPRIISLDENALYSQEEDSLALKRTLETLNLLIESFLFPDFDYSDDGLYESQISSIYHRSRLIKAGVNKDLIPYILLEGTPDYEALDEILSWRKENSLVLK